MTWGPGPGPEYYVNFSAPSFQEEVGKQFFTSEKKRRNEDDQ
jgi:hypothetical protein